MGIREQLFNKFQNGQKPNGDDFRTLIENSFNDNVEVYTQEGMQTQKVKIFIGNTLVEGNKGEWELNYSEIEFENVLCCFSHPIQDTNATHPYNRFLSSVIYSYDNNSCNGVSFSTAIDYLEDQYPGNVFSYQNTKIQVIIIGY